MGETRTGAQIVRECLARDCVTTVFGYPGGAIRPIYDAMLDDPIHHVLVQVGARLRAMMPALDPVELEDPAPYEP
jgi:glyoxylate carboligase